MLRIQEGNTRYQKSSQLRLTRYELGYTPALPKRGQHCSRVVARSEFRHYVVRSDGSRELRNLDFYEIYVKC